MVAITGPNSVWQYSEFPEKYQLAARFLLRAAGRCSSLASCASISDLDLGLVSVSVYWSFAVGSYFYYLIGFWKTCWYIYNPSLYFIPTPRFSVIQQCHNQWKIEVGYLDLVCRPSLLFLYVQKRLKKAGCHKDNLHLHLKRDVQDQEHGPIRAKITKRDLLAL